MKYLFLVTTIILALYSFYKVYKKSKYDKLSNFYGLIVVLALSAFIGVTSVVNPTIDLSVSNDTITITYDGYLKVEDIAGVKTSNHAIKIDSEKEYLNVLITDGYDSVPFSSFTFTENSGITYDLDYDDDTEDFYLVRNFSIASGLNIIAIVCIYIIIYNLSLMLLKMFRENEMNPKSNKFKISLIQRLINIFERSSLIFFSAIFISYFIIRFIDYPFEYIYYLKDFNYILLILGSLLAPLFIAFFVEMSKKEYAYLIEDNTIQVYSGSKLVFESSSDTFDLEETLIRNTRAISKVYHQMSVTLLDKSKAYEGLKVDLIPLGTSHAFSLLDALRSFKKSEISDTNEISNDEIKSEPINKYVLTGGMQNMQGYKKYIAVISAILLVGLALIYISFRYSGEIAQMVSLLLIITIAILPLIVFVLMQKSSVKKSMGIITVSTDEDTISFNDKQYNLNENLKIEMNYPDSLVSRSARMKITYQGNTVIYIIRRNNNDPKDSYYHLFNELSQNYPNILVIN